MECVITVVRDEDGGPERMTDDEVVSFIAEQGGYCSRKDIPAPVSQLVRLAESGQLVARVPLGYISTAFATHYMVPPEGSVIEDGQWMFPPAKPGNCRHCAKSGIQTPLNGAVICGVCGYNGL